MELALDALPKSAENLKVFLHPDDIALLQEYYLAKAQHWPLHANPELTRGGVVVESKDSLVDFSIEQRLATLHKQFFDGELQESLIVDTESNGEHGSDNQNDDQGEPLP